MPVEFLPDERVVAYGCFVLAPTPEELDRFFHLDDADLVAVSRRRRDHNRLGPRSSPSEDLRTSATIAASCSPIPSSVSWAGAPEEGLVVAVFARS